MTILATLGVIGYYCHYLLDSEELTCDYFTPLASLIIILKTK
jgi:hypothetical protein